MVRDGSEGERLEAQLRGALDVVVAFEAVPRNGRAVLGRSALARRLAARDQHAQRLQDREAIG